jgi:hypothetical protein
MEFRMTDDWLISLDEMGFSTDSLMDIRWDFKEMFDRIYTRNAGGEYTPRFFGWKIS